MGTRREQIARQQKEVKNKENDQIAIKSPYTAFVYSHIFAVCFVLSQTTKEQDGRCSLDIVKDESHRGNITSRKRSTPALVTVSRKLRRFQNRHRRFIP